MRSVPWTFREERYPGADPGFLRRRVGQGGANPGAARNARLEASAFQRETIGP